MAGRNRVDILDSSAQKTQLWLKDVERELHGATRFQAYSALRAVLHGVRECLPVGEAAKFAAQMPLVIRGVYFDGFKPRSKPRRMTRSDFYAYLRDSLRNQTELDPALATHAVIRTLYKHLSLGELRRIQLVLPREVRTLWQNVEADGGVSQESTEPPAGRRERPPAGRAGAPPRRTAGPGTAPGEASARPNGGWSRGEP